MPLQFPRILVAALAALASRYNQARLRRAKGWITSFSATFDSRMYLSLVQSQFTPAAISSVCICLILHHHYHCHLSQIPTNSLLHSNIHPPAQPLFIPH